MSDMIESILPRLYERDIDVLLQEELIFNEAVRSLLAEALNIDGTPLVHQCALSVIESTGETDLLVTYSCDDKKGIILIENKIDAEFQPLQPERYRDRAARLANAEFCKVQCLLIAPQRYVKSADSQKLENFDAIISYEALADAIAKGITTRAAHRAALLLKAVEQARNAYILIPVPEVGQFWARVFEIASSEFPTLRMNAPKEKGAQSKWMVFKANLPRRITIDWKITAATVDLSFWRDSIAKPIGELMLLSIPAGATVTHEGSTGIIRIFLSKPPVEWTRMPDEKIREALQASSRLLDFFNKNRSLFTHRD